MQPDNPSSNLPPDPFALRYHRQTLLPWIGPEGQRLLCEARVLLVGCGALGTVLADQLARAGVNLRIVDRDIVEASNLQRQTLFDETDVLAERPKAVAAAMRLKQVNSSVRVEGVVADVHGGNIARLAKIDGKWADLFLDGTDNAPTRFLINDLAVREGLPWIYGAAVGMEGRAMAIVPGAASACLRCVFREPPGPGEVATCDTAGVLAATAGVVASWQAMLAMRLLMGQADDVVGKLWTLDLWAGRMRAVDAGERRPDCRCCGARRFEFLESASGGEVSLCGQNAVQIRPAGEIRINDLVQRLSVAGEVNEGEYFIRCELREPAGWTLTVFPDGRTIVKGTSDVGRAKAVAARYLGW